MVYPYILILGIPYNSRAKAKAASGQEVRAVITALDPVLDKDREAPTRQRQRHISLYTIRCPVNTIRCPVAKMPPPLVVQHLDLVGMLLVSEPDQEKLLLPLPMLLCPIP